MLLARGCRASPGGLLFLAAALLAGCGDVGVLIEVQADGDPTRDLPRLQRFAIATAGEHPRSELLLHKAMAGLMRRTVAHRGHRIDDRTTELTDQRDHPLLAFRLARIAAAELQRRGYVYDAAAPQFIVTILFKQGPYTYTVPAYAHSYTTRGSYEDEDGKWHTVNEHHSEFRDEHTGVMNALGIAVLLLDPAMPPDDHAMPYMWQGIATTAHSDGDTPRFGALLIHEVLREFPRPSGLPFARRRSFRDLADAQPRRHEQAHAIVQPAP